MAIYLSQKEMQIKPNPLNKGGQPVFPPEAGKKAIPLNDLHVSNLDRVQASPTPTKG